MAFCKLCGVKLDADWKTLCATCYVKDKHPEQQQTTSKYGAKDSDTAARIGRSTALAQAVATYAYSKKSATIRNILELASMYANFISSGALPEEKFKEELVE